MQKNLWLAIGVYGGRTLFDWCFNYYIPSPINPQKLSIYPSSSHFNTTHPNYKNLSFSLFPRTKSTKINDECDVKYLFPQSWDEQFWIYYLDQTLCENLKLVDWMDTSIKLKKISRVNSNLKRKINSRKAEKNLAYIQSQKCSWAFSLSVHADSY